MTVVNVTDEQMKTVRLALKKATWEHAVEDHVGPARGRGRILGHLR